MRHRASRPFLDLWHRLPRAAARRPARVGGVLVALLATGFGTYAVVASVTVDGSVPHEADPPAAAAPSTDEVTASVSPSPTADVRSPADPSRRSSTARPSAPTSAPTPTSEPSPSEAGSPVDALPLGTPSAAPAPRPAATRTTSPSSPGLDDVLAPITRLVPTFPRHGDALLTFSSNERVSYTCSLDGAAYTSCTSPMSYDDLDTGWHTFAVRATDEAGNVDASPARTSWHTTGAGPAGP